MLPSMEECEEELKRGELLNPGLWVQHSRNNGKKCAIVKILINKGHIFYKFKSLFWLYNNIRKNVIKFKKVWCDSKRNKNKK